MLGRYLSRARHRCTPTKNFFRSGDNYGTKSAIFLEPHRRYRDEREGPPFALRPASRNNDRTVVSPFYTIVSCLCTRIGHRKSKMKKLKFDNKSLRSLPVDTSLDMKSQRSVSGACFSRTMPTPVINPQMVAMSPSAMSLLDLSPADMETGEAVQYFSGNKIMEGSEPAAHCYCGYQFGVFAGQLGDGAAMYLGEVINDKNERWEIQLKGAGLTPYSRSADGRKVLRSSIREFLCSEAHYYLGIPTTRAGTCITSDSTVIRDIFYNGNPIDEKCTIVLRIAPTFLRFGSFEIFREEDSLTGRSGPSAGNKELLIQLLDHSVKMFYPEIWEAHQHEKEEMYLAFYKEVVQRTAKLVAAWQCVGWCHGVLNTDNMSILGLTIDYGPFGFMDRYAEDFICNASDDGGRYAYSKQPEICKWNCQKLAEDIQDALPLEKSLSELEAIFDRTYEEEYFGRMKKKLGFLKHNDKQRDIINSLTNVMNETGADFTNSFRCLSKLTFGSCPGQSQEEILDYLLSNCCSVELLKADAKPRLHQREIQMVITIAQTHPELLEQLGPGVMKVFNELKRLDKARQLANITQEVKERKDKEAWKKWLSEYMELVEVDAVAHVDIKTYWEQRVQLMNSNNPRFILRNYIAENAIKAAEEGDYTEVQRVYKLLQNPYSEQLDMDISFTDQMIARWDSSSQSSNSVAAATGSSSHCHMQYDSKPPEGAYQLRVT